MERELGLYLYKIFPVKDGRSHVIINISNAMNFLMMAVFVLQLQTWEEVAAMMELTAR